MARRQLRRGLIAVGGTAAIAAAVASWVPTQVCACTTVAERVLGSGPLEVDAAFLQKAAERRVPQGTPEATLIKTLGVRAYARYCLQGGGGMALVCMFPHDANFWRDRHVELAIRFDAQRRVAAIGARPLVRMLR